MLRIRNQIANDLVNTGYKNQSESWSRHNTIRIYHTNKEVRLTNEKVRSSKR